MIIKINFLTMISSILFFLICGIGHTESEIPLVLKYELPDINELKNHSYSVTFTHSTHAMEYKIACVRCHHTLEPGAIAVEETCMDCHENTDLRSYKKFRNIAEEERLEYYILAFHDQCINCHKEIKKYNGGAKAPVACWRCHVRKRR